MTTQLFRACEEGDLKQVRRLLREGCKVNVRSQQRYGRSTPLIHAAVHGRVDIVDHLLNCGADVRHCTDSKQTALHFACEQGHLNVVKVLAPDTPDSLRGPVELLSQLMPIYSLSSELIGMPLFDKRMMKIQPNSCIIAMKDSSGQTPLHKAVIGKKLKLDIIAHLLQEGPAGLINGEDDESKTPLMLAAEVRDYAVICFLIKEGADVQRLSNNDATRILSWCIHSNEVNSAGTLIAAGFLREEHFNELVMNYLPFLKQLSECSGRKVLSFAIAHDKAIDLEVLTIIINGIGIKGILDTNPPMTALMWAAQNGCELLVKELIELGVNVNCENDHAQRGKMAIHYAAENNHIQCGILLTDAGANVDTIIYPSLSTFDASDKFREVIEAAYKFNSKKIVCIIGNEHCGKSSLITSLQNENNKAATQWFSWLLPGTNSPSKRTAGIEPVPLSSRRYGEVMFLDFAGQHEYHVPHEIFLESILGRTHSPVSVIVVVKATVEEKLILQQLQRWLYPVSLISSCTNPVRVIPVASFMDKVWSPSLIMDKLKRCYEQAQQNVCSNSLVFMEFCYLDCRQPYSHGINTLCSHLSSIPSPSFKAKDTPYSISWVWSQMEHTIKEKAIQLFDFTQWIENNSGNLPDNLPSPEQIFQDFADTGNFLYIKNNEDSSKSWLVIDLSEVLHEVYGTLFSRTRRTVDKFGLLNRAKLKSYFPHLNHEMVHDVLISLEFCIDVNTAIFDTTMLADKSGEAYMFFPSLVSSVPIRVFKRPMGILGKKYLFLCWHLVAYSKPYISAHLLHTILIRLARYAFQYSQGPSARSHYSKFWCKGIFWQSATGIDVAVQISDSSVVQVIARSTTNPQTLCQYISKVVKEIKHIINELSRSISATAFLIHPANPQALLDDPQSVSPNKMFPVAGILESTRSGAEECLAQAVGDAEAIRISISMLFHGIRPTEEILEGLLCDFANESIRTQQNLLGDPSQNDASQIASTDCRHNPQSTGHRHDIPPGPSYAISPGRIQGSSPNCSQRTSYDPTQATSILSSTERSPSHNLHATIPISPTATSPLQRNSYNPLLEPPKMAIIQGIIQPAALEWYSIGLYLGIEDHLLSIIETDHPHSVEKCCQTMFVRWLRGGEGTGENPRTWQKVIDVLNTAKFHHLAEELKGKVLT